MKAGTPSWEAELWSLISSGDGEQCPLYEQCRQEPDRGYCISEHREHLKRLLDTSNFDPANYAFLDGVKPSRLFELVDRLAQKYIEMGNITAPPVPERLVTLCDPKQPIEVRELPLKLYQGALWHLKDRWVIHLNSVTTFGRKRFTLFHEAFHILAHGNSAPVFRRRGGGKGAFNELLAECFASCILMPTEWVRKKWAEVRDIDRMAEIFDVPLSAMWLRLKLLGLI